MSMHSRLTFATMLVVIFLMGQTVWATTYYVSTTGRDDNNGTSEQTPFLTIAHAVNIMVAGDITYVRGGTYTNQGYINFRRSGTSSAPIQLLNYPGESPIISYTDNTISTNRIELYNGTGTTPISDIVIAGFEVSKGYNGIKVNNALRVVIRNNWFHDSFESGILGNGYQVTVKNNRINHNGNFAGCLSNSALCNQDHGMYVAGTAWVIANNLIYDNLGYGIQLAGYPFDSTRMPDANYAGITAQVYNNTIAYQNYRSGIVLWQSGAINNQIINNILYENAQMLDGITSGIAFSSAGTGNVINNNFHYATTPGGTTFIGGNSTLGTTYTASGNFSNTANPNMKNAPSTVPSTPDFSLQSNSPVIDAGLTESSVTVDYIGSPRPQGSAFDIGAYEYGTNTAAASPPPPQGLKAF